MDNSHGRSSITEGHFPYQVQADFSLLGDDLVVLIYGGEKPHVGAVAVGISRPSLENPEAVSATTSVFTLTGHKEDELARKMAHILSADLQRNVVVTVGIHVDKITPHGIAVIKKNCNKILKKLLAEIPGNTLT